MSNFVDITNASTATGTAPRTGGFEGFSKNFWQAIIPRRPYNQLTWVNRRYTPADLRSRIPTKARKFPNTPKPPSSVAPSWVSRPEQPPQSHGQSTQQSEGVKEMCIDSPATRLGEWSTLRQMLPYTGYYARQSAGKWGTTDELAPPIVTQRRPNYFPRINSPMTRYTRFSIANKKHY